MLTMSRLKDLADKSPECDRFADMKACECLKCALAKFEQTVKMSCDGGDLISLPSVQEQSAVAALDRIRLAREAVAKAEAAERKAKKEHEIVKRELAFAKNDLEKMLNTEAQPHLFNQRGS